MEDTHEDAIGHNLRIFPREVTIDTAIRKRNCYVQSVRRMSKITGVNEKKLRGSCGFLYVQIK